MFGLKGLLGPYSVNKFTRKYLGQKSFYLEGPADKFEDLFSWDEVNHLLNTIRPGNTIKLVHQKNTLPQSQLANISHWLTEGATLVMNYMQLNDELIYRFSHELAKDVNSPVNINCYISCPSKQGFDLHFDNHDVFIVQVEGEKKWAVFEPTLIKTPIRAMDIVLEDCDPPDLDTVKPYCECVMSEGDILYIPRGHWHYAVAETPSIHLTVGIESTTGVDLIKWINEKLMSNDEFFRQDIPIALAEEFDGPGGLQPIGEYVDEFRLRVKKFLDSEDLTDFIVHNSMLKNQMRRESNLPLIWDLDNSLTVETCFSLLDSQKSLIRFDTTSESTVVYLRGSLLRLEEFPDSLVRTLFSSTGEFSGASIIEAMPEFTWDQVKALLVKMYQSGVIIKTD